MWAKKGGSHSRGISQITFPLSNVLDSLSSRKLCAQVGGATLGSNGSLSEELLRRALPRARLVSSGLSFTRTSQRRDFTKSSWSRHIISVSTAAAMHQGAFSPHRSAQSRRAAQNALSSAS